MVNDKEMRGLDNKNMLYKSNKVNSNLLCSKTFYIFWASIVLTSVFSVAASILSASSSL